MFLYHLDTTYSMFFVLPFTVNLCSKGYFTKDLRGTDDSGVLSSPILVLMLSDSVFFFFSFSLFLLLLWHSRAPYRAYMCLYFFS